VSAPLNLARRPFRNERLPTLLLSIGCAGLALLTVRHAVAVRELLPSRLGDVEGQVVAIEQEIDRLRAQSAELRRTEAAPEATKEWAALKEVVDRRAFSWTGLFAALEKALPPGVRLVSIAPRPTEGPVELALAASGRTVEDALALLQSLQEHPEFESAFLNGVTESEQGVDVSCTVLYVAGGRAETRP
jgi:Tfp pilus assembly protein PilN